MKRYDQNQFSFTEDYPGRFSYSVVAKIDYPYPLDDIPKNGEIEVNTKDELGEYSWEKSFCWETFWPKISERIINDMDISGQYGFDGWSNQPYGGYDERIGELVVEINISYPF
jgi:hypothetical protein